MSSRKTLGVKSYSTSIETLFTPTDIADKTTTIV